MRWRRSGATAAPSHDDRVEIATQADRAGGGRAELRRATFRSPKSVLRQRVTDETTFTFEGVGFVVQGSARVEPAKDVVLVAEVSVDGQPPESRGAADQPRAAPLRAVLALRPEPGRHTVRVKMRPLPPDATLFLERVIVYGPEPKRPPV